MRRLRSNLLFLLTLPLVFAQMACSTTQSGLTTDAEQVEARLNLPNGGYELEDELPAFGETETFSELGLLEAQDEIIDTIEDLPEVQELIQGTVGGTAGRRFVLVAVWGQPRLDWSVSTPTDWSGYIGVNQGAVVARRAIRFDLEDSLTPRTDPRVLPFTSHTQPHHDGLLVNIYDDPNSQVAVQGEVEIALAALPQPITVPFDDLDGFRHLVQVDNLGNYLFIAAEEIPLNTCGAGFLMGRWHRLAPGVGMFLGQWNGAAGVLHGHLGGIYGRKSTGELVFFGKYIGLGGQAYGILSGTYGAGFFGGQWFGHAGPEGVLGGIYRESVAGPEVGGFFLGGWARTNCP